MKRTQNAERNMTLCGIFMLAAHTIAVSLYLPLLAVLSTMSHSYGWQAKYSKLCICMRSRRRMCRWSRRRRRLEPRRNEGEALRLLWRSVAHYICKIWHTNAINHNTTQTTLPHSLTHTYRVARKHTQTHTCIQVMVIISNASA